MEHIDYQISPILIFSIIDNINNPSLELIRNSEDRKYLFDIFLKKNNLKEINYIKDNNLIKKLLEIENFAINLDINFINDDITITQSTSEYYNNKYYNKNYIYYTTQSILEYNHAKTLRLYYNLDIEKINSLNNKLNLNGYKTILNKNYIHIIY